MSPGALLPPRPFPGSCPQPSGRCSPARRWGSRDAPGCSDRSSGRTRCQLPAHSSCTQETGKSTLSPSLLAFTAYSRTAETRGFSNTLCAHQPCHLASVSAAGLGKAVCPPKNDLLARKGLGQLNLGSGCQTAPGPPGFLKGKTKGC